MNAAVLFTWVRRRRGHLAAALLFAAVLVALFAPVFAGQKVFTDTATQQGYVYPWAAAGPTAPFALQADQADLSMPALAVQRRAYDAGELPHVDLYSYGGGYPLYADLSTGQAYPPRMVLAWLFQPVDAHFLFTVGHLWAAAWFTYLLLRRFGTRWLTAVASGLAWMLGSWTTGWMQLAPVVVQSAAVPACLWAVHRLAGRRTWGAGVLAAAMLGAAVVAGHALMGAVTAGIAIVYLAALTADDGRRRRPLSPAGWARALAPVPAVAVGALLLWAVALLPFAATAAASARAPLSWTQMRQSQLASSSMLWHTVWPASPPVGLDDLNALTFVGLLTLVTAAAGFGLRRPGAALGRWLVVGCAVAMLPGPGSWLVYHAVPLMDVYRPYGRLAMYLGFGVVVLGGLGFDHVGDRVAARLLAGRGMVPRVRRSWYVTAAVLVAANTAHLAWYGVRDNPPLAPREAASVMPDTPFVVALRAAADGSGGQWPGRVAALSATEAPGGPPTTPVLWAAHGAWIGVEVSSGYNSSMPVRSQRLLRVLSGEPIPSVLSGDSSAAFVPRLPWGTTRLDLLPRLGYDLVVTPPSLDSRSPWGQVHVAGGELTVVLESAEGNIYRVNGAAAGAHGVRAVETVEDDRAALDRFTADSFDGTTAVLLAADDAADLRPTLGALDALPEATVTDASRGPNGYRFTVDAPGATLVVVPVNWGTGWSATADGHDLHVLRGNYEQLVLVVPAGTSRVDLHFRSPGFVAGAAVSGASVAVAVLVPVGRRRRRRRATGEPQPSEG
ncbi:MAG: hypothetical protein M9961_05125 [Ilumatobacteraceae bacterium]|nr:hypothetical protein [Ilumatobacteraceae bacterium]